MVRPGRSAHDLTFCSVAHTVLHPLRCWWYDGLGRVVCYRAFGVDAPLVAGSVDQERRLSKPSSPVMCVERARSSATITAVCAGCRRLARCPSRSNRRTRVALSDAIPESPHNSLKIVGVSPCHDWPGVATRGAVTSWWMCAILWTPPEDAVQEPDLVRRGADRHAAGPPLA